MRGKITMPENLSEMQKDLLLAFNRTPNHKNINQIIAEKDNKLIYDTCEKLKQDGYFTQQIVFHFTLANKFFSTQIGKGPALTEKGLKAIEGHI